MRRFAVFRSPHYYPNGGMGDFKKSFDTIEEAQDYAASLAPKKGHDVDIEDMEGYE